MRTAIYTTLFAFIGYGLAEETVTISDLSIHKQGTPAGLKIESVSFKVNGIDADNLDCSATSVAFPEPDERRPCGETHYSFTLWAGEKEEFSIMVYHDVGDS
ncbi:hypothetical protein FSARC_8828 [Fusarium sarcochroum]|uniref:AA1-like domain-containing protein n=1 Tax=Fusarium sarcochroum TaxID=1208366 RepID=A0A8H4TS90_9HYPO|nr:hypothetical protein FSARC_8828 [Fusarium sarcochroum]